LGFGVWGDLSTKTRSRSRTTMRFQFNRVGCRPQYEEAVQRRTDHQSGHRT
jgi:hypothetical protein